MKIKDIIKIMAGWQTYTTLNIYTPSDVYQLDVSEIGGMFDDGYTVRCVKDNIVILDPVSDAPPMEFEPIQMTFGLELSEESETDIINRLLSQTEIRLTYGHSASTYTIGSIEYMKKWLKLCGETNKFIEPIWIIISVIPNDTRRFMGRILKGVCEFVDKHYDNPNYNRSNIINRLGTMTADEFLEAASGDVCRFLEDAHDYYRHNRLGV